MRNASWISWARSLALVLSLASCSPRDVELDPGGLVDAHVAPDAARCVAGDTECTNCLDDDLDGEIDGFDVECTSAADDDEGGFATGISGDNSGIATQDCFFDGNSGSGDDMCSVHVCCELDVCPPGLPGPTYDPSMCVVPTACQDFCQPLTPPGCDCFGCCTICHDDICEDIYIQPGIAPGCDENTLGDPEACPRCHQSPDCGQPCGGCILCPGEPSLPPTCTGAACPAGESPCNVSSECVNGEFCADGCCISVVQ